MWRDDPEGRVAQAVAVRSLCMQGSTAWCGVRAAQAPLHDRSGNPARGEWAVAESWLGWQAGSHALPSTT